MKKQTITLKEIAALANVNASTVSRAFSAKKQKLISKEVRDRIMAIAEKYEYEPRSSARSLAHGKSFQLGIILHNLEADLSSHNLSLFLSAFCREAIRNNYQTILLPIEAGEFDMETVKTIRSSHADAYFIGASLMGMRTMDELAKRKIPVATYVSDSPIRHTKSGITCVHIDDSDAFDTMFQMFKARGFKSLATLSLGLLNDHPRMNIQPYAQKYEMTIEEEYFFKSPSFSGMAWRESFNIACKIIDRIKRHKLIFCSSDFAALGLCDALRLAGLEPGKDISVVGYDNVEGHNITAPPSEAFLSSIEKNDHSAGKKMVESLLADIISPERYKDNNVIEIPAKFIPRKSLGWNE